MLYPVCYTTLSLVRNMNQHWSKESLRKQQINYLLVEKQCHLIGLTLFILITDSKT